MPVTSESARTGSSRARITARTLRRDRWWLQPALTELGLLAFVIYSTWAAFQNADYYISPYVVRQEHGTVVSPVAWDRVRVQRWL